MRNAFGVVEEFERRVAQFSGARHAVAVDCCTNAIFLSLQYRKHQAGGRAAHLILPARTYASVPMACVHAGYSISFRDCAWSGTYEIEPVGIVDSAKRLSLSMYSGGLHCLSFHVKKPLPIGRGGMILTDDERAAKWLRMARYDGREGKPYPQERITMMGWHCYMTPEQAARGLLLLDLYAERPIEDEDYPDLREMPVFAQYVEKVAA
mgnify:CR=1 FL=1